MRQIAVQGLSHFWECPRCGSRYYTPIKTLGFRNGHIVEVHPICDQCFTFCPTCKDENGNHTIPFGKGLTHYCGTHRLKINLQRRSCEAGDPSFGKTTTGSTTYPTLGDAASTTADAGGLQNVNTLRVCKFALSENMPVGQITVDWTNVSGSYHCYTTAYIYADDEDYPGAKIVESAVADIQSTGDHEYSITVTSLLAGNYWLGTNCYVTTTAIGKMCYSAGTTNQGYEILGSYGNTSPSTPDPFPGGATGYDVYYRIQAALSLGGVMWFVSALLADKATVTAMLIYCHTDTGNLRIGIFTTSSGVPVSKQWESGSLAAVNADWLSDNISSGTPTSLELETGKYALGWQYDNTAAVPSYTAGSDGQGYYKLQAYGAFPSSITSPVSCACIWSIYCSYTIVTETPPSQNTIVLTEGDDCSLIDYVLDYSNLATFIILVAGADVTNTQIVVTATSDAAIASYGKRVLTLAESVWNTETLAQLRANQLLDLYSQPIVTLTIQALLHDIQIGDVVDLTSATLGLDGQYSVIAVSHDPDREITTVTATNFLVSLTDLMVELMRNQAKV